MRIPIDDGRGGLRRRWPVKRRRVLAASGIGALVAAAGLPLARAAARGLKVVVAGAHPDDPEHRGGYDGALRG